MSTNEIGSVASVGANSLAAGGQRYVELNNFKLALPLESGFFLSGAGHKGKVYESRRKPEKGGDKDADMLDISQLASMFDLMQVAREL